LIILVFDFIQTPVSNIHSRFLLFLPQAYVNCDAVRNNHRLVRTTGGAGRNSPEGIRPVVKQRTRILMFSRNQQRTTYNGKWD